jgi:YceI-like protein
LEVKQVLRVLAAASIALVLAGCAEAVKPPPEGPAPVAALDDYSAAEYRDDGRVYVLDPAASQIRVYAYRGGRAARSGHNHVLSVPAFSGYAYLPAQDYSRARFNLQFRLDQLVLDDPQARRQTGGAFAGELDADAIQSTREHMLGERNLGAARYPLVSLRSTAVAGEPPRLVATVEVNLHGVSRELLVPLELHADGDTLEASGAFALRQTDFGAQPYSILGGLIAVQDPLSVQFHLVGRVRP